MPTSLRKRIDVPARTGRLVEVKAGELVRVLTEDGGQVGDVFVFVSGDMAEYLSAAHTRAYLSRLFPAVGQPFVTNQRRPILTLVDDTSPGRHDLLIPACDPARYRQLGVTGWHASCAENLATAVATIGVDLATVPQPVNVFMDIPVTATGELNWNTSPAQAGASITFLAELDCIVVVSACPQDLVDINGGVTRPLMIEVLTSDDQPTSDGPDARSQ
jgi:uncharacterized protein YcgI (DUF1989 family)